MTEFHEVRRRLCEVLQLLFRFRAMFWPIRPKSRFSRSPQLRLSRFYFHKMTSSLPNHDKEELVYPLLLLPFYPSIYSLLFLSSPPPLRTHGCRCVDMQPNQTKAPRECRVINKNNKGEKKKSASQKCICKAS